MDVLSERSAGGDEDTDERDGSHSSMGAQYASPPLDVGDVVTAVNGISIAGKERAEVYEMVDALTTSTVTFELQVAPAHRTKEMAGAIELDPI